jgi:hypothetical protein
LPDFFPLCPVFVRVRGCVLELVLLACLRSVHLYTCACLLSVGPSPGYPRVESNCLSALFRLLLCTWTLQPEASPNVGTLRLVATAGLLRVLSSGGNRVVWASLHLVAGAVTQLVRHKSLFRSDLVDPVLARRLGASSGSGGCKLKQSLMP